MDLLHELLSLADREQRNPYSYRYYGSGQRVVYLDEFRSRRVWDVLAEALEAGLPMVQSGRAASLVTVAAQPVRFSVCADRVDAGLRLRPVLADGAEAIDPDRSVLVGRPAHGVAWWGTTGQASSTDSGTLRLAPLARPVSAQVVEALAAPAIVVPAADEARFLRQYYPGLVRRADVVPLDESAALPDLGPATLTLSVQRLPGHRMSLTWEWVSVLGAETRRERRRRPRGHRVLVFSRFTRFLSAARQRLEDAGIACCYLDGKTRGRAEVIADFKNGAAPVFLISLKSGGFGLNLTEADYCILLDPWWNPATEAQAVDRVHRIGQNRKVMVYRLVAKDTIEQKVMALQARKAELFSSVLDGGEFASAELTAADIRSLLD